MAYTIPSGNSVDFTLDSYTVPVGSAVNFELTSATPPQPSTFKAVLFNFGGI
jgi:hypothetical protein